MIDILDSGGRETRRKSSRVRRLVGEGVNLCRFTVSEARRVHYPLRDLIDESSVASFRGDWNTEIRNLSTDSRRVIPGTLFFALKGLRTDGNRYIEEAISRGALAVVSTERNRGPAAVSYIQVRDARRELASVARRFYGSAHCRLDLLGVTGTNGKTTVAYLLRDLLRTPEERVGMLGTVEYDLGERSIPASRTTPDTLDVYSMLAEIEKSGSSAAVMEVSSHGIEQLRVEGLEFRVAIFLNLSPDHIDYHGSMEEYFEVKSRLFTGELGSIPEVAIINAGDPYGRRLIDRLSERVRLITFGMSADADFRASKVRLSESGCQFRLHWPGGRLDLSTHLLGGFNVSNALAALAGAHAIGRDPSTLAAKLERFPGVPGRMERIDEGQPFQVVVDYAHTEDALENALDMLRSITAGRILVVFGCGGNRDRGKRAVMTRVVMERSDRVWATVDNPRNDSIDSIFEDMKAGVIDPGRIEFVEDRRRAISLALNRAEASDCLLIAGKGHETFQEFQNSVIPFDDRRVARELLHLKGLR